MLFFFFSSFPPGRLVRAEISFRLFIFCYSYFLPPPFFFYPLLPLLPGNNSFPLLPPQHLLGELTLALHERVLYIPFPQAKQDEKTGKVIHSRNPSLSPSLSFPVRCKLVHRKLKFLPINEGGGAHRRFKMRCLEMGDWAGEASEYSSTCTCPEMRK